MKCLENLLFWFSVWICILCVFWVFLNVSLLSFFFWLSNVVFNLCVYFLEFLIWFNVFFGEVEFVKVWVILMIFEVIVLLFEFFI